MEDQIKGLAPEEITKSALIIVNQARDVIIITIDDYSFAGLMLHEVKDWIKKLDEEEKKITRPLLEGIENARALFRVPKQKANEVKDILNTRMIKWADEQKAKEREEERKLQEAARKRAEEEALQQALEAEKAGNKQEAEEIISTPVYVPPIKVVSEIPKSKESHIREVWSCEIMDFMALIKSVAEGKTDMMALEPCMIFLNAQARAYKQALNIPGVKSISRKIQI